MNKTNDNSSDEPEKIGDHVTLFQRDGRWYANYQHDGKQIRKSLKTSSKKEARRKGILLEADLTSGAYQAAARAPTVAKTIELYVATFKGAHRAAKTIAKYRQILGQIQQLAEKMKIKSVAGLNLRFLDAYRALRADDVTEKTLHTELVLLRQLVNFSLSRKFIRQDPLDGVKLKKPKPRPQPCWTRKEVEGILAAARPPHKSSLTLLAETGMRVGELKFATWNDIDFANNLLLIRSKEGWNPKNRASRSIPLSPLARETLDQLPRKAQWIVTAAPSAAHPDGDHQISERRLLEYLKRLLKKLGLKGHIHTFRHSFVSQALASGVSETIVRSWLGHLDSSIIQQYTHIADSVAKNAMAQLAKANGQVATPEPSTETAP